MSPDARANTYIERCAVTLMSLFMLYKNYMSKRDILCLSGTSKFTWWDVFVGLQNNLFQLTKRRWSKSPAYFLDIRSVTVKSLGLKCVERVMYYRRLGFGPIKPYYVEYLVSLSFIFLQTVLSPAAVLHNAKHQEEVNIKFRMKPKTTSTYYKFNRSHPVVFIILMVLYFRLQHNNIVSNDVVSQLHGDMFRLYNSHHQANVKHSLGTYNVSITCAHYMYLSYALHWPDDGCYTAETCRHVAN